jgi:hypothetical protein
MLALCRNLALAVLAQRSGWDNQPPKPISSSSFVYFTALHAAAGSRAAPAGATGAAVVGGWFAAGRHTADALPSRDLLQMYFALHIMYTMYMCQLEQLQGVSLVTWEQAQQGYCCGLCGTSATL